MPVYERNTSGVESSSSRRLHILLMVLPFVLTGYLLSSGDSGVTKLWDQTRRIEILERDIQQLAKKNADLVEEVELLTNDPKTIERIARERYGMVKDNESVYMVYPKPPDRKFP
jgi:cell division protein FtsB